ncbi:MAG: hypothetical protein KIS96_06825 [Bauldia sp.]|nr:hypothetical protein [Bauldia sp.]
MKQFSSARPWGGMNEVAGKYAGPRKPWSRGQFLFIVWLLGFLGTMVYCAVTWVRGNCLVIPDASCVWDSMLAALCSIGWPIYWLVVVF